MFCKQCGKEIPDQAKFCDGCGSQTGAEPPKKKGSRGLLIGLGLLAVAVIAALSVALAMSNRDKPPAGKPNDNTTTGSAATGTTAGAANLNDYEQVIAEYFKAIEQRDADKIFSLLAVSLNDDPEIVERVMALIRKQHEDAPSVQITHEILGAERMTVYEYGASDGDMSIVAAYKIEEIMKVDVGTRYSFEDGKNEYDTGPFILGKVNNRWYLVDFD